MTPLVRKLRARHLIFLFSLPFVVYAVLGGFLGKAIARDSAYRYLTVFQDVVTLISNNYVEQVQIESVMEGAIRGMMDALDPDSCYLSPQEFESYMSPEKNDVAGIGVEVAKGYYLEVASVLPGSPAQKAGLKAGDLLKSVDGVNTREMNVIVGESRLRGPVGSAVTLQVIRGRQPEPVEFSIERDYAATTSVAYKMLTETIGYIHIASFRNGVSDEVARGVARLEQEGATSLVVDVRNSFGRMAEEGARVAELVLDGGVAAKLQRRNGEKETLELATGRQIFDGPIVLLTNGNTAGSAEIFASAVRHANRAETVGETTSGRAAIQKAIPLEDGAGLVLSVAQYWTPDDKPLLGEGIAATVEVQSSTDEEEAGDRVLEKALQLLEQGAKTKVAA